MADHRVHIDTLEYTRQGLRTRQAIPLQVGQHNRVVLVRPTRQPAIAASYAGFSPNLSFPGPAVLSSLLHDHLAADGLLPFAERLAAGQQLQLFAHTDATGSEADNKTLSDQRAACVFAMLTRDVEEVLRIADAEQWGPELQQVMLRALDCDPGPIDGVFEDLTRSAIESFQAAYGQRAYHPGDEPLLVPELAVDGNLGPDTHDALIDAYVSRFSPRLSPDAFVAKAPANGCAFHNPAVVPDEAANRRASLVVHPSPPAHPDAIPCTTGDAMACPAVEDAAKQACMWYREHVIEVPFEKARHHHFLPSWLKLDNGKYMLSVLTTVPDGEDVEFQVFASKEPGDGVDLPDPSFHLHDIGEAIVNRPIHGVAQVVWEPPPDFAPEKDGRAVGPSGRYVPMFRVSHARTGARLHDSYPATEIVVLLARQELDGALALGEDVEFELRHDSGLAMTKPGSEASPYDPAHLALRFSGVPEDGLYSLALRHGGSLHRQVFENVPYGRLCEADETEGAPASTCEHWLEPLAPSPLGSVGSATPTEDLDLLSLV